MILKLEVISLFLDFWPPEYCRTFLQIVKEDGFGEPLLGTEVVKEEFNWSEQETTNVGLLEFILCYGFNVLCFSLY